MNEELNFKIDEKEVKELAKSLTNTLITITASETEETFPIIVNLEDIVDLDALVSSEAGIFDPLGQLKSWLMDRFTEIASFITDVLGATVKSFIDTLWNSISAAFDSVKKFIEDLIKNVLAGIEDLKKSFETVVLKQIHDAINAAVSFISKVPDLLKPIHNVIDSIIKSIRNIIDTVRKAVEPIITALINAVKNAIDTIQSAINSFLEEIKKSVSELGKFFSDVLARAAKAQDLFSKFIELLTKAPELVPDIIKNAATWVWENVIKPTWEFIYKNFIEPLQKAYAEIVEKVRAGFDVIARTFMGFVNAVGRLPELLWKLLPDWLKNAIISIQKFFVNLWKIIESFIKDPLGWIKAHIIKPLQDAFSWLAQQLWNLLPDWIKNAIIGIQKFFENVWKALQDFFKDPLGYIQKAFSWLAEQIWKLLPDWLKNAIVIVQQFFENVWNALVDVFTKQIPQFFSFLWEQLQKIIKDPVKAILDFLGMITGKILGALAYLANIVKGVLSWAIETFVNTIYSLATGFISIVRTISNAVMKLVQSAISEGFKLFDKAFTKLFEAVVVPSEAKIGEIGAFLLLIIPVVNTHTLMTIVADALGGIADTPHIVEVGGEGEGSGKPLGVGLAGKIFAKIWAKVGALVRWIANSFKKKADELMIGFSISIAFWFFEWLRFIIRPIWLNAWKEAGLISAGFELPSFSESVKLLQRYYPTKFATKLLEGIRDTLYFRGYPVWFYDHVTSPVLDIYKSVIGKLPDEAKKRISESFVVTIYDRFGQPRIYPCSPFFDLPTASQMCTMMVRDIFKSLDDFSLAMLMRGMNPDIAYMFYLLHFKYPSPSTLWEFVSRGISGLLWFTPSEEMMKEAESEAKKLGAYIPKPPTTFNSMDKETITKLLDSFTIYMKWHDYARFAWIEGFTSDNWIVIDTLADIPTKIDIRWMTKWGIFDFMSAKKIGLKSPVTQFVNILEDKAANPKVSMDLTLMCRLLQATGLHPYYVPITAVAESINALSDERTLLRTGIMDVYRYGVSKFKTIDQLMSNLVTASFKVAYLDMAAKEWKEAWINLPVMFLPAERKLLELRALLDRYVRVYKDVLSDVERGFREYIFTEDEGVEILKSMIGVINEQIKKVSAEIVGREITFEFDEDYVKTVLISLKPERYVWTIRRVRTWFSRILGWIIYRLAYAYVTKEDVEKILQVAKVYAKLSDPEVSAIRVITETLVSVAAREYIPTPSMLASIAEIIPEARKLFPEVVKARRIPEKWIPIWNKYIALKPVIDEVKKVLSSAHRLYEYFIIDEKAFSSFLKTLTKYGYEDYEIKLILDNANMDRWYRAFRELIGTPRELVTMAEYSPRARQLALEQVKKMIDALPIESRTKEFLKTMWEEYIRIKPVYDEVRREVTELISDYANGIIDWDTFVKFLEELKKWGLDDYEIDAYKFIAMMRRRRYEIRRTRGIY